MALRVGPSAALVSFAELGGAEEEEVAAGSDAARFVGAPTCLFIYLFIVYASECTRAPLLSGEGVGGGPGEKGELEPGSKRRVTCR